MMPAKLTDETTISVGGGGGANLDTVLIEWDMLPYIIISVAADVLSTQGVISNHGVVLMECFSFSMRRFDSYFIFIHVKQVQIIIRIPTS